MAIALECENTIVKFCAVAGLHVRSRWSACAQSLACMHLLIAHGGLHVWSLGIHLTDVASVGTKKHN